MSDDKKRILVVEDDDSVRSLAARALERIEAVDRCHQFHAVVGRMRFAARQFLFDVAHAQQRADYQAMLRTPEMRERNRVIHTMCRSFEPVMYEVTGVF